jgi:hypothetical protein
MLDVVRQALEKWPDQGGSTLRPALAVLAGDAAAAVRGGALDLWHALLPLRLGQRLEVRSAKALPLAFVHRCISFVCIRSTVALLN